MNQNLGKTLYQIISTSENEEIKKHLVNPALPYFKEDLEILKSEPNAEEYMDQLKQKMEICQNHLNQYTVSEQNEEIGVKQNLIFATSEANNVLLQADIKKIQPEFYERILKTLHDLSENNNTNNPEKNKDFTNNQGLIGVCERKEYQIRLIYRIIDYDSVFVIMAKVKKSDSDYKDVLSIVNRAKYTEKQFKELKQMFTDEEKKEEIISQNKIILEEVITYLTETKRGSKKEHKEVSVTTTSKKETFKPAKPKNNTNEEDKHFSKMVSLIKVYGPSTPEFSDKSIREIKRKVFRKNHVFSWIKSVKEDYQQGLLTEEQIRRLQDAGINLEQIQTENQETKEDDKINIRHITNKPIPRNYSLTTSDEVKAVISEELTQIISNVCDSLYALNDTQLAAFRKYTEGEKSKL